ncbi:hypothetical protein K2P56_03240 [Patescibacteria group bacterium]|nr:hypothetical protein [Patescibacteria group bacterium]
MSKREAIVVPESAVAAERLGKARHDEPILKRSAEIRETGGQPAEPKILELDPIMDKQWLSKNRMFTQKMSGGRIGVDIRALLFHQLPPSRREDIVEDIRFPYERVEAALRDGIPLDDKFIEAVAATNHERWVLRNRERVLSEVAALKAAGDEASLAEAEKEEKQLRPLSHADMQGDRAFERDTIDMVIRDFRSRDEKLVGKVYLRGDKVLVSFARLTAIATAGKFEDLPPDSSATVISVLNNQVLVKFENQQGEFPVDFGDVSLVFEKSEEEAPSA